MKAHIAVAILLAGAVTVGAQLPLPSPRSQYVSVEKIAPIIVAAGKPSEVEFVFRVLDGLHINSNKPTSDLMIPTQLNLNVPTDITVGRVIYPRGHEFVIMIAPDEKLSVYTGEFVVTGLVSAAAGAMPGRYRVYGDLRYQACNDRACFPPRKVPVEFEVNVQKSRLTTSSGRVRRNPPQSPHIHR